MKTHAEFAEGAVVGEGGGLVIDGVTHLLTGEALRQPAPGLAVAVAELPEIAGHDRSGFVWPGVAQDRRRVQ